MEEEKIEVIEEKKQEKAAPEDEMLKETLQKIRRLPVRKTQGLLGS